MVASVSHLLETAPDDIELPATALEQTVGWLSREQRPVPLREFIACRAPKRVMLALAVQPKDAPCEPIKRVTELNDDELRHVVVSVLRESPEDSVLAIVGDGRYNRETLVREVEAGTPLGQQLTAATARHIALLEGLIESGKVKGLTEAEPAIDIDLD